MRSMLTVAPMGLVVGFDGKSTGSGQCLQCRGHQCQRLQCWGKSAPRQDSRMDPARDLLKLLGNRTQTGEDVRQFVIEHIEFGRHGILCHTQFHAERDQPLLGAIVQIPFQAPPRIIGGRDYPRP